ncbi:hypothetical protein FPQ18DRAFT_266934 [Pyronema domesticum]|nr:hypothetical protein FPQ18DRAFT_266934 [Pyronema domesticum]
MIGDDDDDERDSLRGMDSQSPHPHVHRDPVTGVQVDQKRRKRVFSNRTKTGCITCRRRKKKCDEGKPECSNCKRGGFVCEGYSGKVSWQKPPNKAAPTPLVTAPPFIQAKEEPNINHSVGTIMATGSATPSSHSHVTLDNSATPTPAPQNILPYRTEVSTPTSTAPVDPSAPSGVGFSHVTNPAAGSASSNRRSEKEKMMSSQLYMACDPELTADREICKAACFRFNNIAANPMNAISPAEKGRMLHDILRPGQNWTAVPSPTVAGQPMFTYTSDNGYNSDLQDIQVDAPFHCSYGYNIRMGKSVLIEFGCTILDSCVVTIKARTILSPGCKIYSATHPIDPRKRNGSRGPECAKPVTIEEDCWLGGGVTVLGGITIGKGSVVGAGSVVTRDVPPFTVVAGNPARVIRGIYHNGVDH